MDRNGRAEAAKTFAAYCGAQDLIVFVSDPELSISIPALGFPQTLPRGPAWRQFVATCGREGTCDGTLPRPKTEEPMSALGARANDGSIAVLLGGHVVREHFDE